MTAKHRSAELRRQDDRESQANQPGAGSQPRVGRNAARIVSIACSAASVVASTEDSGRGRVVIASTDATHGRS
jgi:hypothetical protein